MNKIRLFALPLLLTLFICSAYASVKSDKEIVVFIDCRGSQNVFDVKNLVEKNRPYFEERGIKITFSGAKGCGFLLVNKRDMIKLDASISEKELLEQCDKFFFPSK